MSLSQKELIKLRALPKPEFCKACPINEHTFGYVAPKLSGKSTELFVGNMPEVGDVEAGKNFVAGSGSWLGSMCKNAHINRAELNLTNIIGCCNETKEFPTSPEFRLTDRATAQAGVEYCRQHHLKDVFVRPWKRVVALGDEALYSLTGRTSATLWRGSALQLKDHKDWGLKVMPTLHPSQVMKNANMFSVVVNDLKKPVLLPKENYVLYPTSKDVANYNPRDISFDFEWDRDGNITLCGITDKNDFCIVCPWTEEFIPHIRRMFENADSLIGHNIIGADTKYIEQFGWKVNAKLRDTMLLHHLVQPDMRHALHFVASVFTNKVFWKGKGEELEDDNGNLIPTGAQWKTWNSPDGIPIEYGGYTGCVSGDHAYR